MVFNIRVYGILVNNLNQVLISDELIKGKHYTKFPGGGLEFGEGLIDCLIREFKEETELNIIVGDHLYTTDFFQVSAFNANHQIISVYYKVSVDKELDVIEHFKNNQSKNSDNNNEVFRWINLDNITEDVVTLPIDKIVVRKFKNNN